MTIKEFILMLQNCIQDEFVTVCEVNDNVISVRFVDGKLINIIVT